MLEYLQKYNQLPQSLRSSLAAAGILSLIRNLEAKYKVNLALVVMKMAIGEFSSATLSDGIMTDCKLSADQARGLATELSQGLGFILTDFQNSAKAIAPQTAPQINPVKASLTTVAASASIDTRVADLINKAKIDLASQSLLDRLKQILRTYLLGVRDKLAAKDALTKPVELGGLAFSSDLADNLLKIADGKVTAAAAPARRPSLPTSLDQSDTAGYDLLSSLQASGKSGASVNPLAQQSRLAAASQNNGTKPIPSNLPWHSATPSSTKATNPPLVKASPIIKLASGDKKQLPAAPINPKPSPAIQPSVPTKPSISPAPVVPATAPKTPVPTASVAPVKPAPELTIIPKPAKTAPVAPVTPEYSKTESGAVKMDDIQFTPRVFTPIDELKYMTLKNFRNLSSNPAEATELIKKKIQSLGKDDFSWRLEGISAWKQSPVNKMYVDIYHAAMSEGKQITQIITDRLETNPEAMSGAEFEAIFSFNQEVNLYK